MTDQRLKPSPLDTFCFNRIINFLQNTAKGHLTLIQPEREVMEFGQKRTGKNVKLRVNSWSFYSRLYLNGESAFGDSYVSGEIESPDIADFCKFIIDNSSIFRGGSFGSAQFVPYRNRLVAAARKILPPSKKTTPPLYDILSPDFLKKYLDKGMNCSAARYQSPRESLNKAQTNKIHNMIEKMHITKSSHVLELSCGWGGCAVETARKTGCRITGVSSSLTECRYAQEAIDAAGVQKLVSVEQGDCSSLSGSFDRIIAIEPPDCGSDRKLKLLLTRIDDLLNDEGIAFLQIPAVPDFRHREYKEKSDWIRKNIFPGSYLSSLHTISSILKEDTNLFIHSLENIGPHYAKTFHQWRENFEKNRDKLEKTGYDATLLKKWEYYLAASEAVFETRSVNNLQLILTRENNYQL